MQAALADIRGLRNIEGAKRCRDFIGVDMVTQ
jgi:hypothetical protein